jgi:alpha-ketoglutarate-dependent taurine dioxygenase
MTSSLQLDTQAWPARVHGDGGQSLTALAHTHRASIDRALVEHGAILFSGFDVASPDDVHDVAAAVCNQLLDYVYRSTPRTAVGERVYTATEYRADETIPMHNENAYQRDWPMKLVFACLQPADVGGETTLARTARVTARLGPELRQAFADRRVMYVRNYGQGVDLSWETTFQTESREEVEAFCRRDGIAWEWLDDDGLRTTQVCEAFARHPMSGEALWFNQAHLFHVSSLGPARQAAMLEIFGEHDLPRHACYGDGSPLDERHLQDVRLAYEAETIPVRWARGDVLLVDNMLVAHGRRPFSGTRRVLVAMGDAWSSASHASYGGAHERTNTAGATI